MANDQTGKGKKAHHRLKATNKEIENINGQLNNARNVLMDIIVRQAFSKIEGIKEPELEKIWKELKKKGYIDENDIILLGQFRPDEKNFKLNLSSCKKFEQDIIKIILVFLEQKKQRSMVENIPKRIEFELNYLKFYIDFTLVASERDGQSNVKGSIIYGISRTLCFSECIFPNKQNDYKKCERFVRCDGLEDKPLISFEVTQHGMIQSSGKLEGEWWIKDKPDLDELHYRTLDLIWKEALDWANEIIVP